jgi:hypothetical protein
MCAASVRRFDKHAVAAVSGNSGDSNIGVFRIHACTTRKCLTASGCPRYCRVQIKHPHCEPKAVRPRAVPQARPLTRHGSPTQPAAHGQCAKRGRSRVTAHELSRLLTRHGSLNRWLFQSSVCGHRPVSCDRIGCRDDGWGPALHLRQNSYHWGCVGSLIDGNFREMLHAAARSHCPCGSMFTASPALMP